MSNIVDWLSTRTPDQFSAFADMVTATVAIFAATFAWLQVRHARKLREDQAQPFVVVSFKRSAVWGQAVNLVVENIGNTVASNVTIKFDQALKSAARSRDINETQLLKEGIHMMPPGMTLETIFDLGPQRYKSDLPMTYRATVTYNGINGERASMEYVLDFGILYGLEAFEEYGVHHAAKSLKEIERSLKKWTGEFGRLKVATTDQDYQRWADAWQDKYGGDTPSLGRPHPAGRAAPSKFRKLREPLIVRAYWAARLPVQRVIERRRELREDARLTAIGRHDLVEARRQMRGQV